MQIYYEKEEDFEDDHQQEPSALQHSTKQPSSLLNGILSLLACYDESSTQHSNGIDLTVSCCHPVQSVHTAASPTTTKCTSKTSTLGSPRTTNSSGSYVAISSELYGSNVVNVNSKSPQWNTEFQLYTHNYGGRVKIPSSKNFVAVHSLQEGNQNNFYSNLEEEQTQDIICIRHGKVSSQTYILDFKAPLSPLTALALMAAVYVT
jgi:hypothetical protein